jgi:hypothetical protein
MKIVPKIVNGVAVQHLAFRFFVTVYVSFPGSDNTANLCGGVIYDARHVVTAAHCLSQEVSPSRIIVRGMDNGNIFDKFTSRDYAAVEPEAARKIVSTAAQRARLVRSRKEKTRSSRSAHPCEHPLHGFVALLLWRARSCCWRSWGKRRNPVVVVVVLVVEVFKR